MGVPGFPSSPDAYHPYGVAFEIKTDSAWGETESATSLTRSIPGKSVPTIEGETSEGEKKYRRF
jgi:hypothetical protein